MRVEQEVGQGGDGRTRIRPAVFVVLLVVSTLVIGVADVLTVDRVRLAVFLIFLPALVAGFGSVPQTAVAGLWGLLALLGSFVHYARPSPVLAFTLLGFTLLISGLSIAICVWRQRQGQRFARLRSTAVALQRQLLPPLPLQGRHVALDGMYVPIEEDRLVGGDVYDAAIGPQGSSTRILIGDVQGKGLPAIGTGFAVLRSFRDAARQEVKLAGVVDALEEAVVRQNEVAEESGEQERFVTALVLEIDADQGARVVNCGHVLPYLVVPGRRPVPAVDAADAAVPLGLGALAGEPRVVEELAFPPGALLLLCTDGVTEARNGRGEFYPLEQRLGAWAVDGGLDAATLVGRLREDVRRFAGRRQRDDIAVLVVRRRVG